MTEVIAGGASLEHGYYPYHTSTRNRGGFAMFHNRYRWSIMSSLLSFHKSKSLWTRHVVLPKCIGTACKAAVCRDTAVSDLGKQLPSKQELAITLLLRRSGL